MSSTQNSFCSLLSERSGSACSSSRSSSGGSFSRSKWSGPFGVDILGKTEQHTPHGPTLYRIRVQTRASHIHEVCRRYSEFKELQSSLGLPPSSFPAARGVQGRLLCGSIIKKRRGLDDFLHDILRDDPMAYHVPLRKFLGLPMAPPGRNAETFFALSAIGEEDCESDYEENETIGH